MRVSIRSGLVVLSMAGVVTLAAHVNDARAQVKVPAPGPAPKGAAAPAAKAVVPQRPANLDQAVATVNNDKITRGDLLNFLSRYQIPPLGPEQIYRDGIETLINTRLIAQFLDRQRITVPPEKVNEALAQLERDLKADGRDLKTAMQESDQTMDDLKREYAERIRWVEYMKLKGTDAELKKFATSHKDLVGGTQVKASHIFLQVPDAATPADKAKIKQKLVAIKQDVAANKLTFADAANKFSEDPANEPPPGTPNAQKAGGDIGYFGLNAGIVEEFTDTAFAMKTGQISDPIETGHGLHLIQVTDRKEGAPIDFEQQKPLILQMYAAELQKQILIAQRKTAQIDIKPMPADLFPPSAPAALAPPSGNAPAEAAKAITPR